MENEKTYYTLKQLEPLVKLTYHHLVLRMNDVKLKYKQDKELLYKKSNIWYIHKSILNNFIPLRNKIDYRFFITIASKNQLQMKFWKVCICDLNKKLKLIESTTRIKYVVETTSNNNYHIHFITSFSNITTLNKLLKNNDNTNFFAYMNIDIRSIYEVKGLHKYFRKQNKPVLLK